MSVLENVHKNLRLRRWVHIVNSLIWWSRSSPWHKFSPSHPSHNWSEHHKGVSLVLRLKMFSSFKLCAKYNTSHTIPCEFWLKVRPGLGVNWCKTCLGCNEKKKRESARTGIKNSFECPERNNKQPILLLKCQYRLLPFNYIWIQPHGLQNKHWW